MFAISDSSGQAWQLGITEQGAYTTTQIAGSAPLFLVIRDSTIAQVWNLVVLTTGQINVVSTTFQAAPTEIDIQSPASGTNWALFVSNGRIDTFIPGFAPIVENAPRDPQMYFSQSKDGGHTWSDPITMDCGQAGQFQKRVLVRRLGRARSWVPEVSTTDPVPWRIIDAFLDATPGFTPQERLPKQLAKMA